MTYFYTHKFLLEPEPLFDPEHLRELYTVEENEEIVSEHLPRYKARLVYAKESVFEGRELKPVITALIEWVMEIEEHNKVAIYYSRSNKMVTIVVAEGERLLLANSYRCTNAETLLYFLSLASQQVVFNPQITRIHSYGELEKSAEDLLKRYFNGVLTRELDVIN